MVRQTASSSALTGSTMASFSPDITQDIRRRSTVFGVFLGLCCIPFSMAAGAFGGCCPGGALVGAIPPVGAALLASGLAAMFLNWDRIGHEEALGVGVSLGLRTGLIASVIGALFAFGTSALMAGMAGGALEAVAASSPNAEARGAGAMAAGSNMVMNFVAAAVGIVPGALVGIIGGVIGAAIKRK